MFWYNISINVINKIDFIAKDISSEIQRLSRKFNVLLEMQHSFEFIVTAPLFSSCNLTSSVLIESLVAEVNRVPKASLVKWNRSFQNSNEEIRKIALYALSLPRKGVFGTILVPSDLMENVHNTHNLEQV